MELYDWNIFCERFADGPERWYAKHEVTEMRLAARTYEELVAQIWIVEFATVGSRL